MPLHLSVAQQEKRNEQSNDPVPNKKKSVWSIQVTRSFVFIDFIELNADYNAKYCSRFYI